MVSLCFGKPWTQGLLEVGFGQNSVNIQDVSQASISNIIFMRFCYLFDTPQPKKPLFSYRKTRISAKTAFHTSHWKKRRFYVHFGIIFRSFWHHFTSLFRPRFLHRFLTSFWTRFDAKWLQNGSQKRPQNAPKTHPKNHWKKGRWFAADGVLDLVSTAVGTESASV